jgi:pantoate--beta-alanine ligase
MQPEIFRTVAALQARVAGWHREGLSVGMVPTMGALHAGHVSLVEAAKRQSDRVVVTLFVNPTQFAPNEDFSAYPRDEEADLKKLAALGVDVLFAPSAEEMYPAGFETTITVGGPAAGLETDFRPHFFVGVATIVAKLLVAGPPDRAFFGEKDFQQLLVVKKLVRDLGLPTEIVGCPTVRERDGLALSSRNAYLSAEERARAPKLHAMLRALVASDAAPTQKSISPKHGVRWNEPDSPSIISKRETPRHSRRLQIGGTSRSDFLSPRGWERRGSSTTSRSRAIRAV